MRGCIVRAAHGCRMNRYLIERNMPGAGQLSAEELQKIARKSVEVLDAMDGANPVERELHHRRQACSASTSPMTKTPSVNTDGGAASPSMASIRSPAPSIRPPRRPRWLRERERDRRWPPQPSPASDRVDDRQRRPTRAGARGNVGLPGRHGRHRCRVRPVLRLRPRTARRVDGDPLRERRARR